MNSETVRIADQLRRAFKGDAWHGPSISELLSGVTVAQASNRPLISTHSIWEIVVHIDLYLRAAFGAMQGTAMPRWYGTEKDWPEIVDISVPGWSEACGQLFQSAEQVAHAIEQQPDDTLSRVVPGRDYDFYYLFHGIVQHSLYHAGQIAILKKALS
jgi:hypothetical protein